MAKVNVLNKAVRLSHEDIIKMQFYMHCNLNKIRISSNEVDCLVLLSALGQYKLSEFCELSFKRNIFGSAQTVRNFITKAEKEKLIVKSKGKNKYIMINKDLNIIVKGNILLNYKLAYVTEK